MITTLLLAAFLAADDISARMAVLEQHMERLPAIVVPQELESQKQDKLAEIAALLAAGVTESGQVDELYQKMDLVRAWLWEHAADRPTLAPAEFVETPAAWTLKNETLLVTLAKSDLALAVQTQRKTWSFAPCDAHDIRLDGRDISFLDAASRNAEILRTSHSIGLLLTLRGFPDNPGQSFILGIHLSGQELRFSITSPEDTMAFEAIEWPKPLLVGNAHETQSVIPCMQGMLVPGDWPEHIDRRDQTNSRTLYMPWWGHVEDGAGVITILETSDDGGVHCLHPAGGPTRIQPLWYSSLRHLRYQRWALCAFEDEASYVSLAKRYRRYVLETGRFVSLAQKQARTPNVGKVMGRPVVHVGALYHYVWQSHYYNKERLEANHQLVTFETLARQLRDLNAKGVAEAYVHLDGWGFFGYDNGHPDVLPPGAEQGGWDGLRLFADTCDELGWIFATHDQYRDFYFNAASFDRRLALEHEDGGFEEHTTWCGGPQTILSAIHAPGYVRHNHDLFAAHGVKVRGAYLDVFSIVPLEESYQTAHPMTRTECAAYRKQCFDLLHARGYVMSSEEPVDRFVPDLDLVHHGPYFTFDDTGRVGIPTPLFSLVYHDSILLPWSMDEAGGWGIPKGDAGYLHCFLNAGMPYVGPGATVEQIARVQEASALSQRCAMLEMTKHEFLDGNLRRQRTAFADGTQVTVDFDAKTYDIVYP